MRRVQRRAGAAAPLSTLGRARSLHGPAPCRWRRRDDCESGTFFARFSQEISMPKPLGLLASLCLAAAAVPVAAAQNPAPATALIPGAKVYDNDGEEVGTIAKVAEIGRASGGERGCQDV